MTEDAEEAIRLGEAIQAVNTSPAHRVIALDEGALSNAARLADLYGLPTDQVLLEAMLLGMRTLSDAAEVARRGRVAQAGRAEAGLPREGPDRPSSARGPWTRGEGAMQDTLDERRLAEPDELNDAQRAALRTICADGRHVVLQVTAEEAVARRALAAGPASATPGATPGDVAATAFRLGLGQLCNHAEAVEEELDAGIRH